MRALPLPIMVARLSRPPPLNATGRCYTADEGLFGFRPFAEVWTGRLAMMGFISSIVGEAVTGRGTLGQLGLTTPSNTLLIIMCAAFGGATLVGTAVTAKKVANKSLSSKDLARYRSFLGLTNDKDWMTASADMKAKGDSLTPSRPAPAAQVS